MSQIDNLLNFVAGNSENRKVMSQVDDGKRAIFLWTIDVFSWLLINCDLFTLNIDEDGNSTTVPSLKRGVADNKLNNGVKQQVSLELDPMVIV